jgi:hypothetical protein
LGTTSTSDFAGSLHVLDTTRVKSGLVDSIDGNHVSETGAVVVGGAGGEDLGFGTDFVGVAVWRGSSLDGVPGVI